MPNEEKKSSTFTWKEVLFISLALIVWGFSFTAGTWIADKILPPIAEATVKIHLHSWEEQPCQ